MFEVDLLDLNGYSDTLSQSVSPYAIKAEGLDASPAERQYTWSETDTSPGASLIGNAPARNVERTVPITVRARFTSALTNLLTNPRPYSVITGWATQGTGSTVTYNTVNFENVAQAVTTGSANSGMKHEFTATAAAYSAGVWVRVASSTAPIDVKFDSETATSITATTAWQFVKTENKTLTGATRSLQILQTDTGSRTIYVKLACAHLGSTYAGFFDGATGDAAWNGTAHASTSTTLTSQDAVSRAIGILGEKSAKAVAVSGIGGLTGYWLPKNASYRSKIQVRALDVSKVDYDWSHANVQVASAEVRLTCHPYYKSPEVTATISSGTKAIGTGALEATITGVKGDVPSPCRVVVTAGANKDLRYVGYGIQGRDYSSGNALILAATSMTTSGYSGTSTAAATGVQTLAKTGTISGGTFTLSFDGKTTSALNYNDNAATVRAALEALASIGSGNVTVSGGPISTTTLTFTFASALASQYIPPMTVTSSLTGGGTVAMGVTTAGNPAYISTGLYSEWTSICDTGNLTHTGDYEVWGRVYDASATTDLYNTSLRLKYSLGDLTNLQTNDPVTPQAVGDYWLAYFGQIHIPVAPTGTQRWLGIIEGKTAGAEGSSSTIRVTDLRFKPIGTGAGEVRSVPSNGSTLSMRDNFSAISGAITGDTATSGQTWATAGGTTDADDFSKGTGNTVVRTATSDAGTGFGYGRQVLLGSGTPTDVSVQVSLTASSGGTYQGVTARFTDTSNFLIGFYAGVVGLTRIFIYKLVAGTPTQLGYALVPQGATVTKALTLTARASGAWSAAVDGVTYASGVDSALATGGTLASGKSGLYDYNSTAGADTRTYSNFSVSIPTAENIACYASQDLEFRTNEVLREVSAGSVYGAPSIASQPFQPELTPAGAEGLTNRILIQTCRNNPDYGPDTIADAFTAQVFYEPTWSFARSVS